MPCPYFCPVEVVAHQTGMKRALMPLGDAYAGACHADPAAPFSPDESVQQQFCNFGYARRKCPRFPENEGPDAVRFCISSHRDGIVTLHYVMEKDHHPYEHGPIEYSVERASFTAPHARVLVQKQAQAYVESYLRRTDGASSR